LTKLVHVISDTNIGGAGRILLAYLNRRDRAAFDVSVIVPEGSLLIPDLVKTGVKLYQIQNIAERSFSRRAVFSLLRIFKEAKPGIVHTHAALSARIAAKMYGKCKIVHTRHSVFDQSAAAKRFPLKCILGFINNFFSHAIIAVSPAAKLNLTETGTNPDKVTVIYNGVEPLEPLTDSERAHEREKWGLSPDDFVCSIIGRLVPEKGHDYILEAAALLKQNLPRVRVLIAGIGPRSDELRETADKMGLDNVIFTGFIGDIRRILSITDLSLNASYGTEATGLSLIEGMSLGVPVAASDFGGNPYVVSDGVDGVLFPKKNGAALYDAVAEIYGNGEKHYGMCVKAYEKYRQLFTAQVMADGIENVYRKLIDGRGDN
jgi:glycosyltransferase involved in cell wall biosynthesis